MSRDAVARRSVIVVGSGIAGLTAALRAQARGQRVDLIVKGGLEDGCTPLAQGGIAGCYGPSDSPALHALDTLQAGDGLGDPLAIAALVDGAQAALGRLLSAGVPFDRTAQGEIARGLEAAHSRPRIAHAGGDATGAAISRALVTQVRASGVSIHEQAFATDLLVVGGRVRGIRLLDGTTLEADAVVLATGGAGQLFAHTTNPSGSTGDGIAMALRAGAAVADLEFVQFHPTVLALGSPFLISEAVRGAGAVLVDSDGHRFLIDQHPNAELAPRDVVARAVARQAAAQNAPVRLDATMLSATALARRFPTIDRELRARGLDWARDPVPVTPAAHYLMGVSRPISTGAPRCPGCGLSARPRDPECTAPTASPRTHCSKARCSAPGQRMRWPTRRPLPRSGRSFSRNRHLPPHSRRNFSRNRPREAGETATGIAPISPAMPCSSSCGTASACCAMPTGCRMPARACPPGMPRPAATPPPRRMPIC